MITNRDTLMEMLKSTSPCRNTKCNYVPLGEIKSRDGRLLMSLHIVTKVAILQLIYKKESSEAVVCLVRRPWPWIKLNLPHPARDTAYNHMAPLPFGNISPTFSSQFGKKPSRRFPFDEYIYPCLEYSRWVRFGSPEIQKNLHIIYKTLSFCLLSFFLLLYFSLCETRVSMYI